MPYPRRVAPSGIQESVPEKPWVLHTGYEGYNRASLVRSAGDSVSEQDWDFALEAVVRSGALVLADVLGLEQVQVPAQVAGNRYSATP